jgi:hypothetical protein
LAKSEASRQYFLGHRDEGSAGSCWWVTKNNFFLNIFTPSPHSFIMSSPSTDSESEPLSGDISATSTPTSKLLSNICERISRISISSSELSAEQSTTELGNDLQSESRQTFVELPSSSAETENVPAYEDLEFLEADITSVDVTSDGPNSLSPLDDHETDSDNNSSESIFVDDESPFSVENSFIHKPHKLWKPLSDHTPLRKLLLLKAIMQSAKLHDHADKLWWAADDMEDQLQRVIGGHDCLSASNASIYPTSLPARTGNLPKGGCV